MGRSRRDFQNGQSPGGLAITGFVRLTLPKMQTWFRVELVMTASIRLRMIFPTSAPRIWGETDGGEQRIFKMGKAREALQ